MGKWVEAVKDGMVLQGIQLDITSIPLDIYLKVGDILHFCYIEKEDDDLLIVSETTSELNEEIRIINTNEISHIAICYVKQLTLEGDEDVMYT